MLSVKLTHLCERRLNLATNDIYMHVKALHLLRFKLMNCNNIVKLTGSE